jgi:2-(1,2-epoxy-1,2-dihydrophenyl)acetyl-CoA isomerase
MELLLLNRVLDAATALDWGIVNSVVDDDTVPLRTAETAARIAQGPRRAYESMKRLIMAADLECHLEKESECIVQQGGLRESHEGIRAFIEKRPANFKAI